MNRYFGICTSAFLAGLLSLPCQAGDVEDYLTKNGQLKAAITIRTGAHGLVPVGGPKSEVWVIQPTGEWTRQVAPAKGKLSAKQLAALAQHLATQDFNSLPRQQGYQQQALDEVYPYVMIEFGKQRAEFSRKTGESRMDYLPKPGDPNAAAWSRFIALELVFADMLGMPELAEKKDK